MFWPAGGEQWRPVCGPQWSIHPHQQSLVHRPQAEGSRDKGSPHQHPTPPPTPPTQLTRRIVTGRIGRTPVGFLRGCYCAGLRRTRANISDSRLHQSSIGLIFYQGLRSCNQGVVGLLEPIPGGVTLPGRVARFIAEATRRQTVALKLPSRDSFHFSQTSLMCVFLGLREEASEHGRNLGLDTENMQTQNGKASRSGNEPQKNHLKPLHHP